MISNSNIAHFRKAQGMTVSELAKSIGISQSYLSHIENGRRPLTEKLVADLSRVLNVPPEEIRNSEGQQALESDRLNSWLAYIRINRLPFVKALGYHLKDNRVQLADDEDLKKFIVDFVSRHIATAVRTELEENPKLLPMLREKLKVITGRDIV
jgi:transcriptional regulator with XRE-family HTH domain